MYSEKDLTNCPICGNDGITAPDVWGDVQFFHKVESPRLAGFYSFTEVHSV